MSSEVARQGIISELRDLQYQYQTMLIQREITLSQMVDQLAAMPDPQPRQPTLYTGTEGARRIQEAMRILDRTEAEYRDRFKKEVERMLLFGDSSYLEYNLSDEEKEEARHKKIMEEISNLEI